MRGSYTGSTTPPPRIATIVVDTTPLASGHGIRGIGRYLDGVVGALVREEPAFVEARVRFLVDAGQDPPVDGLQLSLIHICRCRRAYACSSRRSPCSHKKK